MTEANPQLGFTIAELVLFLALSSLMIVAAMLAVSGRTQTVQYTDSTRLTESFFESRQTQALNGVVRNESEQCTHSGGYGGGSSNGSCVFLGYLFEAQPSATESSIDVYQVYGKRISSNDPCLSVLANVNNPLVCAEPRLSPVTAPLAPVPIETFDIPWSLTVSELSNNGTDINLFGFLRNPIGQDLIPVAFTAGTEGDANIPAAYRTSHASSFVGNEFEVNMCIQNDTKSAAIQFGAGESELSIDALFDDAEAICPAV